MPQVSSKASHQVLFSPIQPFFPMHAPHAAPHLAPSAGKPHVHPTKPPQTPRARAAELRSPMLEQHLLHWRDIS